MENKFKTVSIDTMIDKHVGKLGTEKREAFEKELRIDLLLNHSSFIEHIPDHEKRIFSLEKAVFNKLK